MPRAGGLWPALKQVHRPQELRGNGGNGGARLPEWEGPRLSLREREEGERRRGKRKSRKEGKKRGVHGSMESLSRWPGSPSLGADTDGVSLNRSFSGPLLLPPKNQRKLDSLSQLPLLPSRAHQFSWSVGAVRALEELVGSPAKGSGGGGGWD